MHSRVLVLAVAAALSPVASAQSADADRLDDAVVVLPAAVHVEPAALRAQADAGAGMELIRQALAEHQRRLMDAVHQVNAVA